MPKPLVLFYATRFCTTGGGPHAMTLLAERLADRGYAVVFVTRPPMRHDHRYVRRLSELGIPVRCLRHLEKLWLTRAGTLLAGILLMIPYAVVRRQPLASSWGAARSIFLTRVAWLERRKIRKELTSWLLRSRTKGRKLLLHVWGPAILTPLLIEWAKENSVPAIYHEMGEADEGYVETWNLQSTLVAISKATRLICCSPSVAENVRRVYRYQGKIDTIPFMIKDPLVSSPETAASSRHRVMFGAIGRLVPHKRHSDILQAVNALVEDGCDVGLLIAGSGPLRGELERLSHELGIGDRVDFIGEFEDLSDVMAKFDIFVLTSSSESQCMPITESMAYGKPVVASRFGGIPDFVDHGVTGFLVTIGDHEELVHTLKKLAESPELREKMGAEGRARYLERYTEERVVEGIEQVYAGILEGSGDPEIHLSQWQVGRFAENTGR